MTATDPDRNEKLTVEVPQEMRGVRLDKFLGAHPDLELSRTKVVKLISEGLVLVAGLVVAGKQKLAGGEIVTLSVPPEPRSELVGEDIPLDILHEDDQVIVVNKPAGMVTHPGVGNHTGTLVNALVYRFEQLSTVGGAERPGIVHRLDKDTSGLLVVARSDSAYAILQKAIQNREVKRSYLALVWGHLKKEEGVIDLPIGRSSRDRTRMAVTHVSSREAVTRYRLTRRYPVLDLLELSLETGRTHQIRVHLSHVGHPVLGDPDYGGRDGRLKSVFGPERPLARQLLGMIDRQALHAQSLEFDHPGTGLRLKFEAPLPEDFRRLLEALDEAAGG
jgi:23S rRNA pseudouridine1911/1915/1917 synthase